jgi:hypothetical protein
MRNQLARPASSLSMREEELDYLFRCSRTSLQAIRLKRLNEAQIFKRRAIEAIYAAIDAQALALSAELIQEHGEEWIALEARPKEAAGGEAPAAPKREPAV